MQQISPDVPEVDDAVFQRETLLSWKMFNCAMIGLLNLIYPETQLEANQRCANIDLLNQRKLQCQ